MADRHLDAGGSNTSAYDTWAKAATAAATVFTGSAAGDNILVGSAYTETVAGINIVAPNTPSNPIKFLSGTKGATSGLTALVPGALLASSNTIYTFTGCIYANGITFRGTSGSSHTVGLCTATGNVGLFEDCAFEHSGVGASSVITFGSSSAGGASDVHLRNCSFKLAATGQRIGIDRTVEIFGGAWSAGGTSPTGIFDLSVTNRGSNLRVEAFDFSVLSSTVNIIKTITDGNAIAFFRDCKLPASWSGSLVTSGQIKPGSHVEMWNCDNGSTNYRVWIEDYFYTLREETTIVKSGGASDGTTPIAWKMSSSANCAYPSSVAVSPDFPVLNETTGSSKTVTVEIIHDTNVAAGQGAGTSFAFRDDEVWLEVEYLGDSSFPLGSIVNDSVADVLTAATDQDSSSATWTTTGLTTPVKQKLSVSFTPQKKGYFLCRVCMAVASKTIYIDPVATVS